MQRDNWRINVIILATVIIAILSWIFYRNLLNLMLHLVISLFYITLTLFAEIHLRRIRFLLLIIIATVVELIIFTLTDAIDLSSAWASAFIESVFCIVLYVLLSILIVKNKANPSVVLNLKRIVILSFLLLIVIFFSRLFIYHRILTIRKAYIDTLLNPDTSVSSLYNMLGFTASPAVLIRIQSLIRFFEHTFVFFFTYISCKKINKNV